MKVHQESQHPNSTQLNFTEQVVVVSDFPRSREKSFMAYFMRCFLHLLLTSGLLYGLLGVFGFVDLKVWGW